jgi:hypothetical protein
MYIQEAPGSNPGQDTDKSADNSSNFPVFLQANNRIILRLGTIFGLMLFIIGKSGGEFTN